MIFASLIIFLFFELSNSLFPSFFSPSIFPLHFSDYQDLQVNPIYSDAYVDSIPADLPDHGSRKARILKRKTKLKRHKSSLRATRAAPISSVVDHIIVPTINVESNEKPFPIVQSESAPAVVLRTGSALSSLTR